MGGTSAGAAVIAEAMFTGDADLKSLKAGATVIAKGLGLWPEALIDQHFLTRQRGNRLMSAVMDRPALVGVGIAAVMARKVRRPRTTFVLTAVALTVLSFVPDLTFGFDAGSAATLITLHIVAATIVVPTLAGRLARTR